MALTVLEVATAANIAIRQQFDLSDSDQLALFIQWVDQVHKDVLHTSPVWRVFNTASATITSSVAGSPYALTTTVREIVVVQDLQNSRVLIPWTDVNFPAASSAPPEKSGPPADKWMQSLKTNVPYPQFYLPEVAAAGGYIGKLHLLPDPSTVDYAGTIRYFYTKVVESVTASGDTLVMPDDGLDVMVAGVAMHASNFLPRPTEADRWAALYGVLKRGNV